ncbi:serum amyloid A [Hypomesus transpacificus]|uniref:serum amyloid A n=1 Tax=Hypomesus transpacificus TaxID=137520 RepID=UPI001F07AC0A|nr:serum amyloid A [Hypomesus transpacificus]
MKLPLVGLVLVFVVGAHAQWYKFPGQAIAGAKDMHRAYSDMKKANWLESDKYFHARGNQHAAQRGPGGRFAASVISNVREMLPRQSSGNNREDSRADQDANRWGRNGGDLSRYRPKGLPDKY